MNMKRFGLLVFVASLLAATGCTQAKESPVGKIAPDFTLKSFAGEELTIGKLRGRPVMLYFFASW